MQSADPKKDIPWDIYDLPSKLQERGFSEREVRIATLVLFGFTYAQMADILNRAENGIGKDKYLIAKKLGVSVKDLQTTLCEIACRS
jgi:DNA-binding CsgD family transcriptional regulator